MSLIWGWGVGVQCDLHLSTRNSFVSNLQLIFYLLWLWNNRINIKDLSVYIVIFNYFLLVS